MKSKELLERTRIFSSLPPMHLEQISSRLIRGEYAKGKDIVTQGDPGESLYLIESGQVGVYVLDKDFGLGIEVTTLGQGDCVGELALITGEPRNATCTALVDTVAWKLEHSIFEAVLGQAPMVQTELMKVLATRLSEVSAKQGVPFVSLANFQPDVKLSALVPLQVVRTHFVVPIEYQDGAITLAAIDPSNTNGFNEIKRLLPGIRVRPVATSLSEFNRFVDQLEIAAETGKARQIAKVFDTPLQYLTEVEDSERASQISGVDILTLVNRIIATGIESGASDIHVEPGREGINVRYRINGSLESRFDRIPIENHKSLISRFKVLAKLDITDTRKPQEGRISVEIGDRTVDLRLSLIPTKLGQKLVIRILDSSNSLLGLDKLVLAEKVRHTVRKMVYEPHGVVLVTGPTGSGKTTTMYSALLERRNPEINIVTVEDPVEFHLDGLAQVEVGGVSNSSFADILRSFLRQDPDIVLVGETRDAETAKLALQAGLTGRLVFTSFHTNDCISAIVRLAEMGMEPFAMANSLIGVIHQRLVRRICPFCRAPFEYYSQIIENLRASGLVGEKVPTLYRTKGCERCSGLGFIGRVAAFEILVITDEVRAAIANQSSPSEIIKAASQGAFVSLAKYLNFLLQHGITVPGEALGALPRQNV
jgi:type II secretory ATPase GspE/PulE/Tfp pilus assembly ATPase PilB-like protein